MVRALLVSACLLLPAIALGQAKSTEVIFSNEGVIEGTTERPDADTIDAIKSPHFKSLVQIRKSFGDKLVRSVSEL